jgi:hypothetical protein
MTAASATLAENSDTPKSIAPELEEQPAKSKTDPINAMTFFMNTPYARLKNSFCN